MITIRLSHIPNAKIISASLFLFAAFVYMIYEDLEYGVPFWMKKAAAWMKRHSVFIYLILVLVIVGLSLFFCLALNQLYA